MSHRTKKDEAKLLAECTYPLTALGVVHRVITELGVLDVTDQGFELVECAPDVTPERVREATDAVVAVRA